MGIFLPWLSANWFVLVQSLGIIASFLLASASFRAEARHKRAQSLFHITEQHRQIWTLLYAHQELSRILDPVPDLETDPITWKEQLFVHTLILHLKASFDSAQSGVYDLPETVGHDIRHFFSLPIPQATWERSKEFQSQAFLRFMSSNLP